ncbi:WhiB family transcription factor [Mycobacterium phage Nitzel]|uniref:WhiB family transcription factor n=1 Tax=Mycobacterium phage Nitzel TaxID=2652404 RepID=A0A5J6T3U4_9CAUD|nr:WhiB family transcription factor [Mycobacterium phage Nitzel]QFG04883.1 WhiB family transcription factor [Mycobacterium phage Nitzel]
MTDLSHLLVIINEDRHSWQDKALCAQVDLGLFFPEKGESAKPAKRICGRCEVRAECLQTALDNQEHYGVFGGVVGA